jgi:hypothetical protein
LLRVGAFSESGIAAVYPYRAVPFAWNWRISVASMPLNRHFRLRGFMV